MEKHIDYLTYDGRTYAVFTCRTEETVLGTVWRFVMDDRKTLVLVPIQTPKNRPARPGVVPDNVSSALSALAGLAFDVLGAYMPQAGTKEYDDVPLADWGKHAADRLAKQDKAAEKAAFELIQTRNAKWNGKRMPVAKLKRLRDVLFNVANENMDNVNCSHHNLTYAVAMWKEITGHDPAENIVLAYGDKMPSMIEEVARQTADAEGMTAEKARRLLMERISYVAEMWMVTSDGHDHEVFVLLQDARCTVHNKEDEDEFRRVAPTEAEREAIAVETEKIRLKGLSERAPSALRSAGFHAICKAGGESVFRAMTPTFAEVEVMGKRYRLPPKGAEVIGEFVGVWESSRTTRLTGGEILKALGRGGESLADAFKGYKEERKALIRRVPGSRDLYEFIPAAIASAGETSGQSPP